MNLDCIAAMPLGRPRDATNVIDSDGNWHTRIAHARGRTAYTLTFTHASLELAVDTAVTVITIKLTLARW